MSSLNKALIIGRLGRDPEARATPSGLSTSKFSVATSFKSKGEEVVQWHNITAFDRLADVCNEYLRKGSLVYVEGRIQTRKYTDKDGIERYVTEIICERMQMLGGREDNQSGGDWGGQSKDNFESQGKAPGNQDYARAKGGGKPVTFDPIEDGSGLPF